ncbi:MAG: acyl--CoA ligase [Bacilli bacterium]|nr:acyl--CoA ligase [Bacilli bacterium]
MKKYELTKLKEKVLKLENPSDIEKLIPHMNAYQFLRECCVDYGNMYAINYLGRKFTYNELLEQIDTMTKGYAEMGVKPGDNVCMAMLTTPEAIISMYAIINLGATVYMVNATHEKPSIREELLDAKANLILINDIFYDNDVANFCNEAGIKKVITASLDESIPVGFYGDIVKFKIVYAIRKMAGACLKDKKTISWKQFANISKESRLNIEPIYDRNAAAVITSTSGSTGKPKRPVLTNDNLNAMCLQMGMTCDTFAPNDSIFSTLPIWIIYSLSNSVHEPLCLGVTLDLDPLFSSKKVSKRIKQYRFNHWNTIPAYIEDMIKDKGMRHSDCSCLKSITTGGDFRTPKLKFMAEKILQQNNSYIEIGQGYGATEACGCFGYSYINGMPAESVGKPLTGNKFKIVDLKTGEILGPNEKGEIYLYSPCLMKEYYGDKDATEKGLIKDDNGIIWYKTRDIGHYDEQGILYLDGRLRRIELTKDANGLPTKVFPDKIKQALSMFPGINQCEVIMIPDEKRITKPIAYIVLDESLLHDQTLNERINKFLEQNLIESYAIPADYVITNEIPRKPSLKNDIEKMKNDYIQSMESQPTRKRTPFKRR